jgi:UDP-3-O-[3-hydroxymyristoyl] glucosamine N-acyltransferase
MGKNVTIGAFATIAAGCTIGDCSDIGSGTVIKNADIGRHVEIGSNTVIGGTGFGYAKMEGSEAYAQFPHYGRVLICDNVSIGSNTCIDRGSLSDTLIEEGVKIDNLVHIAHNVKIGKNSLVIACSMIAGSTVIGENCWIAPASTIRNGIHIGKNATVGLAATVTKNVEEGQTVMGSPAADIDEFLLLRSIHKEAIKKFKKEK